MSSDIKNESKKPEIAEVTKKKSSKNKVIGVVILAAIVVGALAWGGNFWYTNTYFFTTENASVSANMVTITPLVTGNVANWLVKEGDLVEKDQVLGRQDLKTLISSNDLNGKVLSQTADSLISKAEIRTPISGKVVQSNCIQGETISPGMQVAVVADTNNLFIKANVEETDVFRIKEGQKVSIKIDAYPGKVFTGYVDSIGEATQSAFSTMPSLNTSGNFSKVTQLIPVKVNIANIESLPLKLGFNATVKISVK